MLRHAYYGAVLAACLLDSPAALAQKAHPPTGGKECTSCHAKVLAWKVLHAPAKEKMCDACHQIPAAGGAAALTESPDKLCYACHEKKQFDAAQVHGPAAVGACVACHDPHGSTAEHLARSAGPELCLTCHVEMQAKLSKARFRHKTLEAGCVVCHNPHASPRKYQLTADGSALCAKCHEKVLQSSAAAAVKHAPVGEGAACLNCHDPHVAESRPQLKAGGVAVCLNCHSKPISQGGVATVDVKKLLDENRNHHGPIREQNCAGCHLPHGSAYFRLLRNEYPKEFYSPFRAENFALCFGCHDAALPRDERTTTLTDFRDGDRNLHYVHVNKAVKGRTCRSCHETHASASPNHIRKSVPFGSWDLPINFAKTANGGSCAPGCHAPQKYERAQAKRRGI